MTSGVKPVNPEPDSFSASTESAPIGFSTNRWTLARKLLLVGIVTVISGLIGEMYGAIFYASSEFDYYIGFRIGASLGLFSATTEIFYIRAQRRSWIRRVPFLTGLLVRIVVLTIVIRICLVGNQLLTEWLLTSPTRSFQLELTAANQVRDTLISLVLVIVFVIITQVFSIIGFRRFINLVVGRYFRPVSENRVFMFVDIVGSTRLARSLGDVRFHDYLSEFFHCVDGAIVENGGEIVSYVGDAVIVTWPLGSNRKDNARCFLALRSMLARVNASRSLFESEFGEAPVFRAALHGGPVVVGECGDSRRQVTFLGDTPNLTSRIETVTKEQDEAFLASATLVDRLDVPAGMSVQSIGKHAVRGVDDPVELFRVVFG